MIIPAILENKFEDVREKLELIGDSVEMVHIDFADNTLVKSETFLNIEDLEQLNIKCHIELHLMVSSPSKYIKNPLPHVRNVLAHVEADKKEIETFISTARTHHYRVGLSINANSDISLLDPFINEIDYVQFMTVVPGMQGQEFKSDVLSVMENFKQQNPTMPCQTDGGVNLTTIGRVLATGAEDVVVGSAIFSSDDPIEAYEDLVLAMTQSLNRTHKIEKIAFLGGAAWKKTDQAYKDAFDVAKILAENGYEIVNGGGPGVMRASTLGAQAGGGRALAITYYPNKPKRHYEGMDELNTFDEEVKTLDYFDRTKVMLQTTDVHIVFNGSIGTMSEIGMSWVSSWIHEPNNKPIILYGDFWNHFVDYVKTYMYLKNGEEHILKICNTPEQVLEYIKSLED